MLAFRLLISSMTISNHVEKSKRLRSNASNFLFQTLEGNIMSKAHLSVLSIVIACLFSTGTQAALQTWRLTATAYNQSGGFTPPAFAAIGQTVTIDYLIDNQTPSLMGNGLYSGAVQSIFFNGEISQTGGYISATGDGLNAINVWPISGRADGVDFLSFNRFGGPLASSVIEALNDFSATASTSLTDFRIDFGTNSGNSVWAHPTSFTVSSVPVPAASWLLGSGLLGLIGVARKRKLA